MILDMKGDMLWVHPRGKSDVAELVIMDMNVDLFLNCYTDHVHCSYKVLH
jgi:hypothetical protein